MDGSLAFVNAETGVVARIRRAEMAGNVHEQYMPKHAVLLAQHPRARFPLPSSVTKLSADVGDWYRAVSTWIALAPALWGGASG